MTSWKSTAKSLLPLGLVRAHERRMAWRALRRSGATLAQARLKLPRRSLDSLLQVLPAREASACVSFDASTLHRPRDMALPLAETLALSAITRALAPRTVFEIGTFEGATTLALARNAPAATLWTLDLPAAEIRALGFRFEAGTQWKAAAERDAELRARLIELRGDAATFDFEPWRGGADLIFVDADHSYASVARDTASALEMLAPGGAVVWDDYDWTGHPDCAGVARALHELASKREVFHLQSTRLAVSIDSRAREELPASVRAMLARGGAR